MCGKKVLQDYAILDKHMRGNHNIDIAEYKDVLINGDVLKQLGLSAMGLSGTYSNSNENNQEDTESLLSGEGDREFTPTESQEDMSFEDGNEPNQVRNATRF